jgi:glycosyltransferase involved in cell wall biosynthesis
VKIAVVYQLWNPGGLTRFTHAVIDGLLDVDETATIGYFASQNLVLSGRIPEFSDPSRVVTVGIADPKAKDSNVGDPNVRYPGWRIGVHWIAARLAGHQRVYLAAQSGYRLVLATLSLPFWWRRRRPWNQVHFQPEVLEALKAYDVVYLPFPYHIDRARIDAPVVATFHDLNHKYFPNGVKQLDRQLKYWTSRADASVVSTRFVESDLVKYYPGAAGRTSVVFVAPYSYTPIREPARLAAVERFGLTDRGYVIYPANHSRHKNLLGLLRAADLMKRSGGELPCPIVITGYGTDGLGAHKWPSLGEADRFLESSDLVLGRDVRALGLVTDEEIDALTRSATLVVSPSLYEAGCGPALDAWQFGVPVAFSNIPPFLEQLDALGVEAWSFDPKDPEDIARVIARALDDRGESLAMAARSKEAIAHYTWKIAAAGYMEAFRRAIEHYRAGLPKAR